MNKRMLLYCTDDIEYEQNYLKSLNIYRQTEICCDVFNIVKKISNNIRLLLVGKNDKLDNTTLEKYIPKENLPQIIDIEDIKFLKNKNKTIFNKNIFTIIDNYLYSINIPPISFEQKIIRYSLYAMAKYQMDSFNYKTLKVICALLGHDYSRTIKSLRLFIQKKFNQNELNFSEKRVIINFIENCYLELKNNWEKFNSKNYIFYFN